MVVLAVGGSGITKLDQGGKSLGAGPEQSMYYWIVHKLVNKIALNNLHGWTTRKRLTNIVLLKPRNSLKN